MKTKAFVATALLLLLTWTHPSFACAQELAAAKPRQIAVNLFGEVSKPGRYVLPEGSTALDALAAAGGQTPEAKLKAVKLIHPTAGDRVLTDVVDMKAILDGAKAAPVLHEGDSLSFPRVFISVVY